MHGKPWIILSLAGIGLAAILFLHKPGTADALPDGAELPILMTIETEEIPDLKAHEHTEQDDVSDPGHGMTVTAPDTMAPEDLWVSGIRVTVENAPRAVLHHLNVVASPPGADGASYGLSIGQDVNETGVLTPPYATFVRKGTRLSVNAMFHDALPPEGPGGEYRNVRAKIELLGLGFDASKVKAVLPLYLALIDSNSPEGDSFIVPPNAEHFTRYSSAAKDVGRASYTFPSDGTLVDAGAHLHAWQGGEEVGLYINGALVHSFVPYHSGPNPWEWSTDRAALMRRVHAGDVLTISATYSNPQTDSLVGAMGVVGASFAPDAPLVPTH